jgi:hypothetical protein
LLHSIIVMAVPATPGILRLHNGVGHVGGNADIGFPLEWDCLISRSADLAILTIDQQNKARAIPTVMERLGAIQKS